MARILVIVAVALLLTNRAWAQSAANCEQIRQAVAQYGYEEARRHALIHYGPQAVEAGLKCLPKEITMKKVEPKAVAKHQPAKKKKYAGPTAQLPPK
jgi:hypothetical protein